MPSCKVYWTIFNSFSSLCFRQEDTSDWLLTDNVSSWSGTPADRGWRYLRQSLERHDSTETDYKYTKATLKTILGFDRSSSPPPWLIHSLEVTVSFSTLTNSTLNYIQENHHEYLIRLSLRYENFESAIEYTLSLLRKVWPCVVLFLLSHLHFVCRPMPDWLEIHHKTPRRRGCHTR